MKAIWSIILFGAIAALGVFCLSPIPKGMFEGYFKAKTERKLRDAGFSDPKVEMNHLHAQVSIEEGGDTKKAKAALEKLYGVYIEGVTHHNTSPNSKSGNSNVSPKETGTGSAKHTDKPLAKNPPEPVAITQPTQFHIEWDERSKVNISGRLADKTHLDNISKAIISELKNSEINTSQVTFSKSVQNPFYLEELLTLISPLVKLTEGKFKLSYKDPFQKNPGRPSAHAGKEKLKKPSQSLLSKPKKKKHHSIT